MYVIVYETRTIRYFLAKECYNSLQYILYCGILWYSLVQYTRKQGLGFRGSEPTRVQGRYLTQYSPVLVPPSGSLVVPSLPS